MFAQSIYKRNAGRFLLLACIFFMCVTGCQAQKGLTVKSGAEILIRDHLPELESKRVGLVMNPTSRIRGTHILDTLISRGVNITALFAPEHGFRGNYGAGEIIRDGKDEATGLPVFSLYGSTRRPTGEMLDYVDILLFDMQDVGARFYTYISTMGEVMAAADQFKKTVWILDRPNPAGGEYVAGWIRDEKYDSFIGAFPIPVAHGLTIGEVAMMIKNEGWKEISNALNLRVIKMEGWKRIMKWDDLNWEWIPPSPNLPSPFHAWVYLGTCFFEGTTLSEGRGTDDPFLLIGSPDLQVTELLQFPWEERYGARIIPENFKPRSIPGRAINPKFKDKEVQGFRITTVPDKNIDDPVSLGLDLMRLSLKYDTGATTNNFLHLLSGTDNIDKVLREEEFVNIPAFWEEDVRNFREFRKRYLLYE